MGIIRSIFRSRDKPKDFLNGGRFSFFFGGTSSGKPVNETTAMQMTAVYSCVGALPEQRRPGDHLAQARSQPRIDDTGYLLPSARASRRHRLHRDWERAVPSERNHVAVSAGEAEHGVIGKDDALPKKGCYLTCDGFCGGYLLRSIHLHGILV